MSPQRNHDNLPDIFKSEVSFTEHAQQSVLRKLQGSPSEKIMSAPIMYIDNGNR